MITSQDSRQVYEAFPKAKVLYMSQHPWEIFDQDQWDGSHWKQVVQLVQQQAWEAMKHYGLWTMDGRNLFKGTHADSHSISLSAFVSNTMGRTHRTKQKGQKGEYDLEENPV